MKPKPYRNLILTLALLMSAFVCRATAEDALFFGNSFTAGSGDNAISKLGGVPKLVEAIATSKGKKLASMSVIAGGKDFGFHLAQPKTEEALAVKKWDYVVLQDYSTTPTRAGKPGDHLKNAETFYKRIQEKSPGSKVVLYETWAYAPTHKVFAGSATPKGFSGPADMVGDLQKGYAESEKLLEAIETGEQVAIARVGTAFARWLDKNPDLALHSGDAKHASARGSYLAALVLYATIFHDSPRGAAREFPGLAFDAAEAEKLQQVAAEVTAAK